ncbi:MAG: Williams-Beuren syndrome chromosome region 16 protein [Paramarteilia canceri]
MAPLTVFYMSILGIPKYFEASSKRIGNLHTSQSIPCINWTFRNMGFYVCQAHAAYDYSVFLCKSAKETKKSNSLVIFACGLNDFGQLGGHFSPKSQQGSETVLFPVALNLSIRNKLSFNKNWPKKKSQEPIIIAGARKYCLFYSDEKLWLTENFRVLEINEVSNLSITQITSGFSKSLILTEQGEVYEFIHSLSNDCGRNYLIQKIDFSSKIVKIAASADSFACLDEENRAFVWGSNEMQQFGPIPRSSSAYLEKPQLLKFSPNEKIIDIKCSSESLIVLTESKKVFISDPNFENLLIPTMNYSKNNHPFMQIPDPLFNNSIIRPDCRAIAIYAGLHSAAVLNNHGEIFTWGSGDYGQLGHHDRCMQPFPRQLVIPHSVNSPNVSLGASHTHILQ